MNSLEASVISESTRAASAISPGTASPPAAGYLGPGRVLEVSPRGVLVRLEGADSAEATGPEGPQVLAALGFACPYQPAPGDELLIMGRSEHYYAVGVLSGANPGGLHFEGDLDLRAVGGTLTLSGDEGVEVEGQRITLRADALRTFAGSLSEKADEAYRWVKGLTTLRAGESRRVIEGEDYNQSHDSIHLAKGTVKIDGHQIHMGH